MNEKMLYRNIQHLHTTVSKMTYQYWMHYNVFTFRWWVLVAGLILPWVIWWRLVKRTRLIEILLYGTLVLILATIFDGIGSEAPLWGYPCNLTPVYNRFTAYDFSVLPVLYMVVYQHVAKWKAFFWIHTGISTFLSFVVEPLTVRFNIYDPHHWKSIYSFPIYIFIALSNKYLMQKLFWWQQRSAG